jgi:hypothetical protein
MSFKIARTRPIEVGYISFKDFDEIYEADKNQEIPVTTYALFDSIKHRTRKWYKPFPHYQINLNSRHLTFSHADVLIFEEGKEVKTCRVKEFSKIYRRLT